MISFLFLFLFLLLSILARANEIPAQSYHVKDKGDEAKENRSIVEVTPSIIPTNRTMKLGNFHNDTNTPQ